MGSRIVIHAGVPKTGTTSIQSMLTRHRGDLASRGILYPDVDGKVNHNFLAVPFRERPARMYRNRDSRQALVDESLAAWQQVANQFRAEGHDVLLLSAEHMAASSKVDDVAHLLDRLFPAAEMETVFYLRRPSRRYPSALQQHLKADHALLPPFHDDPLDPDLVVGHEAAQVTRWSEVGTVVLREFAPEDVEGFDVTRDFLRTIGLGDLDTGGRRANPSVSAEAMQFLQDHRRAEFGGQRGVFDPSSTAFFTRLAHVEALTPRAPTRPRLHDLVANMVDYGSADALELRDRFGFTYTGLDYSRYDDPPPELDPDIEEVRDLMPVHEQRLAQLANLMTLDGALHRLAVVQDEARRDRERIERLRDALDVARERSATAQAEVAALRSSTSWRLTQPVRAVGGAVRRVRRRS